MNASEDPAPVAPPPPNAGFRPDDAAPPSAADRLTDEFARQIAFLREEMPVRAVAALLGYGMGAIYLPWGLILALAAADLIIEIVLYRLMADPAAMARSPRRRGLCNALVFLTEFCFALPAGLIWHDPDPYAKALAIGLLAGSMMHMTTVRAIHLPQGLSGAAALAVVIFGSNAIYWVQRDGWRELGLTTLCGLVAIGYSLAAMISNNRLHRETADGRRAAQQADAAKGRFLARMSHELRTPLNAILGLAHAELHRAADPEQKGRLAVLVSSAEGLARVLDDGLDVEAVGGGGLAIRRHPAVPEAAIRAAAELFRTRIEEHGLELSLEIGAGLDAPAMLDSQRLGQCLANLLSNALRHTLRGRIAVAARRVAVAGGGTVLEIDVSDTGTGIDPARQAEIFRPRAQMEDGGRVRRGLGLSIARDLARAMGGDLVLLMPATGAGAGAGGSRFRLTVEMPAAAAAPAPTAPPLPEGTTDGADLCGLRVLVVDDLASNRMVACACLRLLGAHPSEAATGPDAVAAVAAGGIDAVLLDMNMPEMDGQATLAAIRALPGPAARLRVVAMTADALPEDRARYLAAGLDGYLAKPFTPERLAAALAPPRG